MGTGDVKEESLFYLSNNSSLDNKKIKDVPLTSDFPSFSAPVFFALLEVEIS